MPNRIEVFAVRERERETESGKLISRRSVEWRVKKGNTSALKVITFKKLKMK